MFFLKDSRLRFLSKFWQVFYSCTSVFDLTSRGKKGEKGRERKNEEKEGRGYCIF